MGLQHKLGTTRARLAWWLFVAALGGLVLFVLYAFVGTFTLGVFLYYASRPAYRRIRSVIPWDGVAAMVTLIVAAVPILLLLVYTAVRALLDLVNATDVGPGDVADLFGRFVLGRELSGSGEDILLSLVQNPGQLDQVSTDFVAGLVEGGLQTIGVVAGVLIHVGLAFTLAFALLRDGDDLAEWVLRNVAGDDSTAHAYGTAVDRDLQTVYFGNVLFVFAVAVVAAVVYHGFNLVAPAEMASPTPTVLALLTGVTSLVPLVVGKLVYLPVVAYVGVQATQVDGGAFAYPLALLGISFLVLDILPQTFLQPFLAGRTLSTELMMFAYILGPLLFGWYGFFLLPLIVVVVVQAARIVVVELIHGDRLTTDVTAAASMGSDPAIADPSDRVSGPRSEPDADATGAASIQPTKVDVTPDQSGGSGGPVSDRRPGGTDSAEDTDGRDS